MKYIIQLIVLIILACGTISSCDWTPKPKKDNLTPADSIWVNFMTQMENGNVEFLIKNSLDSIQCVDCNIGSIRNTEFYEAEFIFRNHLDKLKHLKSLNEKEYSTYKADDQIIVNYSFPSTFSQGEGYNLIFTFIKVRDRYLFTGMIVT